MGTQSDRIDEPELLLVHGGWHGSWCWRRLQRALTDIGVKSTAMDLPGHGHRSGSGWLIGMRHYIAAVQRELCRFSRPPVVLGHSMAGAVISGAAEEEPARIQSLVYLSAFVPLNGESLRDVLALNPDPPELFISPRLLAGRLAVRADRVRELFYGQCTEEDATWATARLHGEPIRVGTEKLRVTGSGWGSVPRHYIVCTQDRAISPGFQSLMIGRTTWNSVSELTADHSPFLSRPHDLAELLHRIVRTPG